MKFIIADDHKMFLDTIKNIIELKVANSKVDEANSFSEFVDRISSDKSYDLALMDYRMPGVKGMNSIRWVLANYPDLHLAIISGFVNKSEMNEFVNLGVAGFIPKTLSADALIGAINIMLSGERYIPSIMFTNNIDTDTSNPSYFTPREIDVLRKLHLGYSNKQIANALKLEETTIKMYISKMCKKLDANNRTQLVVKSIDIGILN